MSSTLASLQELVDPRSQTLCPFQLYARSLVPKCLPPTCTSISAWENHVQGLKTSTEQDINKFTIQYTRILTELPALEEAQTVFASRVDTLTSLLAALPDSNPVPAEHLALVSQITPAQCNTVGEVRERIRLGTNFHQRGISQLVSVAQSIAPLLRSLAMKLKIIEREKTLIKQARVEHPEWE